MADLHTYKKLPSDPCLSEEKILAYIDGKLSAAEQHACETHMADCAMCEDAVEGLSLVKDRSVLAAPPEGEPAKTTEGKVVPLHKPNRNAWFAAAAVLVLVLSATFILNMMTNEDGAPSLAQNKETHYDSTVLTPTNEGVNLEKSIAESEELKNEPAGNLRNETGNDPAEEEYKVTAADVNGAADAEQPVSPPIQAEMEEEKKVSVERIVVDEVADGDAEDFTMVTKPEAVATSKDKASKAEDSKEQSEKKNNLLEFATGIAGGAKRSETQKQDAYVDDNRDIPNAPANNTAVAGNTQTPSPQVSGATFDLNDGTGIDSVSLGARTMQDSSAVDQLELSYQNGLKQLEAGQTSTAIVMFDKVLANKNHARYEDAEFQKAKALIKANKKEEAKTLLKSIEAKKGKHAAEAAELLKTL